MASSTREMGRWMWVRASTERSPFRVTVTFTVGDLPDGWKRTSHAASTWVGVVGAVCIAPILALIAAGLLRAVGVAALYEVIAGSSVAILAATLSLFIGIPIAIAVNLWRIVRIGVQRHSRGLDGVVALELAPLHLFVVVAAALVGALFIGHLAVDSFACVRGVRSAC